MSDSASYRVLPASHWLAFADCLEGELGPSLDWLDLDMSIDLSLEEINHVVNALSKKRGEFIHAFALVEVARQETLFRQLGEEEYVQFVSKGQEPNLQDEDFKEKVVAKAVALLESEIAAWKEFAKAGSVLISSGVYEFFFKYPAD